MPSRMLCLDSRYSQQLLPPKQVLAPRTCDQQFCRAQEWFPTHTPHLTILLLAAGHLEVARMLLQAGASANEYTFDGERCHYVSLYRAIRDLLSMSALAAVCLTQRAWTHHAL